MSHYWKSPRIVVWTVCFGSACAFASGCNSGVSASNDSSTNSNDNNSTGAGGDGSGGNAGDAGNTGGGGNAGNATGGSDGNATTSEDTSNGSATTSPSDSTSTGDSSTSTTGSVDPIPPTLEPGTCGLDEPAFCDKFDSPSPGGRGGDIDDAKWSFARYGHPATYSFFLRGPLSTQTDKVFPSTFCGEPFSNILPGDDVRFCEGIGVDGEPSQQLNEVMDDEGDFGFNSMRIRQPFDFTDRVGTIVWDVDAKVNPLNIGHGWWIEVWITEDPTPMPYHEAPTVLAFPRNGVGFAFQFGADCPESETDWNNALETVTVTEEHDILHSIHFWEFAGDTENRCFRCADTELNRFELRITQDRAELWVSDYDDTELHLRSEVEGLDLPFSRGYVHFQHAAYNAPKDGNVTGPQTFRWDNIGFDGPTYPTPRGYDVPDNTEVDGNGRTLTGYHLMSGQTQSFELADVDLSDAVGATFNFDVFAGTGQVLEYRFNEGTWHEFTVVSAQGHDNTGMRGFSVPVALDDLVDGTNTIDVRFPEDQLRNDEMIGNLDITIEAP